MAKLQSDRTRATAPETVPETVPETIPREKAPRLWEISCVVFWGSCEIGRRGQRGAHGLTGATWGEYKTGMEHTYPPGRCPADGQQGRRVARQTLQSLLVVDLRLVSEPAYWFCPSPTCPVAYFNDAGTTTFIVDQVRVPIWQKQAGDPAALICYCFKITNHMLRDDAAHPAGPSITAQITAGTQQGLCACDLTNPQGSCCLGNIRRATKADPSTP